MSKNLTIEEFIEIKNKDLLDDIQLHKINWVNENSNINIEIKTMK